MGIFPKVPGENKKIETNHHKGSFFRGKLAVKLRGAIIPALKSNHNVPL